jgi:hypothetical protein
MSRHRYPKTLTRYGRGRGKLDPSAVNFNGCNEE